MKSNNRSVIISGSSITDDTSWPTWATWVKNRYNPTHFINCGIKGTGNELILTNAVAEAKKHENPIVIVQLTNVDKWDWYIENPDLTKLLVHEKHSLIKLANEDNHGFWSTGSHFPKWKEYYKENYFSLEHSTFRTIQLIQWFQMLCQSQGWQHYIIFDSPILSVTENYLNTGNLTVEDCFSTKLVDNTLNKVLFEFVDTSDIYLPGIIGYAKLNNHPWYTQKNKGHPGSLVHYHYTKDILAPVLDRIVDPVQPFESFVDEATVYQRLFEQ